MSKMIMKIKQHLKPKPKPRVIVICNDCIKKNNLLIKIDRGLEAIFVLFYCLLYKKDDKCPFNCSIRAIGYPFKLCSELDEKQLERRINTIIDRIRKDIRKEVLLLR